MDRKSSVLPKTFTPLDANSKDQLMKPPNIQFSVGLPSNDDLEATAMAADVAAKNSNLVLANLVVDHKGNVKKADKGLHKGDENEERGNWSNQVEFVLSCIGYAVGLGNIWRFPYLCYKNGGGAFVIIYWILSACVGLPIIFLEQSLGQYTSKGPLHCWQFAPIVTGAGLSMVAVSFVTVFYYDIIISWSTYYFFASLGAAFTSQALPWTTCDSAWADYRCEMLKMDCLNVTDGQVRAWDGLCYNNATAGLQLNMTNMTQIIRNKSTVLGYWNETLAEEFNLQSVLAPAQYYHNYVLGDGNPSYNWSNFGVPQWPLVLCLLFVWVIVFISLSNGIKTSGKIVYVTAVAPYLVIGTLIVRGATLPGAGDGIMYFLKPNFELMKQPEVWYAAAGQLFFSLSVGYGGMIALASYNKFNNNIVRDAIIVVFADTFTSFIASFAVFSVIGYGAHVLDRPVEKVVEAGTGLAFIVYPKVLAQLPGAIFFSIIFFLMLICIGLSSQFNYAQTVFTALLDYFPKLRQTPRNKLLSLLAFSVVSFLLGLPFLCPAGPRLFDLVDTYATAWSILLVGFVETTAICWLYGFKKFVNDLKIMMDWLPVRAAQILAVIFWGFVSPGILLFIMIFTWSNYKELQHPAERAISWLMTWFVAIWVPLIAIWMVWKEKGSVIQRLKAACKPKPGYGPYLYRNRNKASHLDAVAVPYNQATLLSHFCVSSDSCDDALVRDDCKF